MTITRNHVGYWGRYWQDVYSLHADSQSISTSRCFRAVALSQKLNILHKTSHQNSYDASNQNVSCQLFNRGTARHS